MRIWKHASSAFLALLIAQDVEAEDGPVDWTKAPGISSLRGCAATPLSHGGWASDSLLTFLTCTKISCVCRVDLIDMAHEFIKTQVLEECGEDANVDVEQAIKVYNDYCSANGYNIPGHTYIITTTMQQPTDTVLPQGGGGVTEADSETTALTAPTTTDFPAAGGGGTGTLNTVPYITTVATVTVDSGARPRAHQFLYPHSSCTWIHFLPCLLVSLPMRLIRALPESMVVTEVPSPPSAAVTQVRTSFVDDASKSPVISTQVVEYIEPPPAITSTTVVYEDDGGESESKPESRSGGGKQGLTTLETVGVVCAIITGLITTVATVWMCARRRRGGLVGG